MGVNVDIPWTRLEQWSPIGFMIGGGGFLVALALLVVDTISAVTVPEMALSLVVIPSIFVLTVFALTGFYPYVADASPRLALAGLAASVVGAVTITTMVVGKTILHVLGVIAFTDEGPLVAGFFLWLIAYFLSVFLYGVASFRSAEPSRLIGILLLIIVVEPASTLLNDLVGFDFGIALLYLTLGVAGAAFVLIGYQLRTTAGRAGRTESASEMAT